MKRRRCQPRLLLTLFSISLLCVTPCCERQGGGDPASAKRVRALMARAQPEAAIPLLRSLLEEDSDAELELLLASALLDTGKVDEAWNLFQKLLNNGSSFDALHVDAARALNRMGRFDDSRDLLLEHLTEHPGDRAALHVIAVALRRLGKVDAASALTRRRRELELPRWEENRARGTQNQAWKALEKARSLVSRNRLSDALDAIDEALQIDTKKSDKQRRLDRRTLRLLTLLKAEILIKIVGLRDASASLWAMVEQTRLVEVDLARARLLLRLGAVDTALGILASTEKAQVEGLARDLLRAHRARLLSELGESRDERTSFVGRPFDNTPVGSRDPEIAEIANLCRAELLMKNGKPESARRVVGQSTFSLAGGLEWAGAIRIVADRDTNADLSALVDFPHVIELAERVPVLARDDDFRAIAARVKEIFDARRPVLAELLDASADGSGSEEAWSRLLQLYAEAGALRKAREIAWLRWSQGPSDARTCIQLAKTLKRPEEVCERLSVIHRALQRHPDNESLLRLRAQDLKFLGVTP